MSSPRVVLGMQGVQMPANAVRGIGRWCTEYVLALIDLHPECVAGVSVDETLPLPALVSRLPSDVPVISSNRPPERPTSGRLVFHALSPLEDLPIARVWPRWARDPDVGLVATVFDMIPLLFPADHFQGHLKRLLEVRYEFYRQADATIGISTTTVDDAVRLLGLESDRCFVASGGVSPLFTPLDDGAEDYQSDLGAAKIRPGFVVSIGNVDPRKNLDGLIAAYAALPFELRRRHQLVLTCSQADRGQLTRLTELAEAHAVEHEVVVLPFVTDELMVNLYQHCVMMVYPSLYEGLGLPIIEAMTCGAAAICSDTGPMREIVSDERARFDPRSIQSMTETMLQCLTDPVLLKQLRAKAPQDAARYTWATSIDAALRAYDRGSFQ